MASLLGRNGWLVVACAAAVAVPARADNPPASGNPPESTPAPTASDTPPVRITISKEITAITEPLRKDGYVDYIAALNERHRKGVTPENNASVLFWRAMGPADIRPEHRAEYWRMLGISPLPEKGDYC